MTSVRKRANITRQNTGRNAVGVSSSASLCLWDRTRARVLFTPGLSRDMTSYNRVRGINWFTVEKIMGADTGGYFCSDCGKEFTGAEK